MAKPKTSFSRTITVDNTQQGTDYHPDRTRLDNHINDTNLHVDTNLRDNINYARKDIEKHVSDQDVHVTVNEKIKWNSKETVQGSQSKANKVMSSLESHKNDRIIHLTKAEKDLLKDKYTKAEVRNLLKHALTGLVFLEAVNTYSDLDIKYHIPQFNSCVYIRGEKKTYIYNGTKWIPFNVLFTPDATNELDGLMSNTDKMKLDSIEENANYYIHPDDNDTKHVSTTQIDYWDNKADNQLVNVVNNGLMSNMDKVKLDSIEENANYYEHPEKHDPDIISLDELHRFVTDDQINAWDNKAEKEYVDSSSNNILATAKAFVESKISGIFNANEEQLETLRSLSFELKQDENVKKFFDLFNSCTKKEELTDHILNDRIHMSREDTALLANVKTMLKEGVNHDWNETDSTSPKYIMNKPESLPANGGNADTVGGYSSEQLIDKTIDKMKTTVISTDVNDITGIFSISPITLITSTHKDQDLVLRISNRTIRGINDLAKFIGSSIKIIGNNNIIEDICITNDKDIIVNKTAIIIEGDNNTIRNTSIINYDKGIVIEGSNNNIYNNYFRNIRSEAIEVTADNNSNYGNIIEKNRIVQSHIGISIISSKNSLTKNHITKNNILNCSVGIVLSNRLADTSKTTMNIISENIVVRNNGSTADYSLTHKTIISEFSSKNIINCNITSGKEIYAPNDILSNNIS